jgi:hypothetical protein
MEDDMKNRVVDIRDADQEEKKPLKQRLGDHRPSESL